MKDMEKLFSNLFTKDENGFYNIDEPLDAPGSSKPISENCYEIIKDYLFDVKKELSFLEKDSKSYFKGGESEALVRLERKVSSEEEYIRNFRKPRTVSTNKPDNPLEPETTGLSPYLSFGCFRLDCSGKKPKNATEMEITHNHLNLCTGNLCSEKCFTFYREL